MSVMVKVENVSMMFNLSNERVDSIKEYIVRMMKGTLMFQEFWALRNVSFELERGESLGIIGLNGSGKSTLLKLIAGIMKPTKGSISTYGSIAPMIELGAGFDMDLSASENIYLNGAILGYSRQEMADKFDDIIAFAELDDFVDVPIKNFSSGMIARLGFSIATIHTPDILILDEVLAVGDYKFQEKSFARTEQMIQSGATVLFVSHSAQQVGKICKKALWLDKGLVKAFGDSKSVCEMYSNF